MAAPDDQQASSRATVAVYDRPRWWRRRKTWMIALPVVASLASLAIFVWIV
jgi:hypothetical protein